MKYILIILLVNGMSIANLSAYNGGSLEAQLPSDQTWREIQSNAAIYSESRMYGDDEFDGGPPTDGGAGGGPVGVPIGAGIIPLFASVVTYLFFMFVRGIKSSKRNFKQP